MKFLSLILLLIIHSCQSQDVCPVKCQCEKNLTVVMCHEQLFEFPTLPSRVEHLDLSGANLGPVLGPRYMYLPSLKYLDLSHNGLVNISHSSFRGFVGLEHLKLSNNYLRGLPNNIFCDNTNLNVLDVSDNLFRVMPDAIFRSLENLEVFSIRNNKLKVLHLGPRWQVSRKLKKLDFSYNNFWNISGNAFEFTKYWIQRSKRSLNLRGCSIHKIENGTLSIFNSLHGLDLSDNNLPIDNIQSILQEMQESRLKRVDLSGLKINSIENILGNVSRLSLEYLDLSNNTISAIPSSSLGNMRSLINLNMSRNRLESDINGIKDLGNLISLDISHNKLQSFPLEITTHIFRVTNLDISHNKLQDSTQVNISPLKSLMYLNLSHNELDSIVLPQNTSNLKDLIFAQNKISNVYSIHGIPNLNRFDISSNQISHLGPFLFTHTTKFQLANFSNNKITEIDHRSFLASAPHAVDLSNNLLTTVKFGSWSNTSLINLSANKLSEITDETFYGMSDLKVLDVSKNKLRYIQTNSFKYLVQLRNLNLAQNFLNINSRDLVDILRPLKSLVEFRLSYNYMTEMNSTVFSQAQKLEKIFLNGNNLTSLSSGIFNDLNQLQFLNVSGNPFVCDCDLLEFRLWLEEIMISKFNSSVIAGHLCSDPPRHLGISIFEFEVGDFECNLSLFYTIIVGSVGLFVTLIGIVASLIWRYCRKRKGLEDIMIIRKKRRTKDRHKAKKVTPKSVLKPSERHVDLPRFRATKFALPNILTSSPADNWRHFRDRRRPFYVDRYGRRVYVNGVNHYHTERRYPLPVKPYCVSCNNTNNKQVRGGTFPPRNKGDLLYCNLCSESKQHQKLIKNTDMVVPYDKYYWV